MSRFARISTGVILGVGGGWIVWLGALTWYEGRGMAPAYGEHDRLVDGGGALTAIGGLVIYLAVRTLRRGEG